MGGLIVGVLLAALVAPYLIDWNSFRPNLERYAADLLGQPVRIAGNVEVSMLPAPSLTVENVEVGDTEGLPMATLDRFTVRVELLPLLAGEFRVREMTLDRPLVNVSIDDAGRLDWLMRQSREGPLDPDDVSFERIVINDGRLHFVDARTGGEFVFDEIGTDIFEGASLAGPWRIRGSMICRAETFCEDGVRTSFSIATGRVAADGTVRVTADVTPQAAGLSGTTVRAEGMVVPDGDLLAYGGSFRMQRPGATQNVDPTAGWSVAGDFRLEPRLLTIEAMSLESADGRLAFTGSGTLRLGDSAAFDATLTSRQIDLDQRYGAGGVVAADDAGAEVWRQLGALALPRIPGRISLTVPSVIVSGSLLRDIAVEVVAGEEWQVESLTAQLPGGKVVSLTGALVPGGVPSFAGQLALEIEEPSVFATWWHGRDMSEHGIQPIAVDLSVEIGPGRYGLQNIALRTGQSVLTGGIIWTASDDPDGPAQADLTFTTRSFDVDQLRTLAILLTGPDYALAEAATGYAIKFDADELRAGNVTITGVAFDGFATSEGITVNDFTIGDADGARVSLTGTIAHRPEDTPGGDLTVTIDAARLDGLVALAERLAPDNGFVGWFAERAPFLAPLNLRVAATGPGENDLAYRFEATGTAADTALRAEIDLQRGVADWAVGEANIVIDIDAADGARLVRQLGLADPGAAATSGPATIDFSATGVPAGGLTTHLQATLAGVLFASDGRIVTDGINAPRFDGPVSVTGDIAPLALLLGYGFPTATESVPVVLEAEVNTIGREFGARIATSSVAGRSIVGDVRLDETAGGWRLGGDLGIDAVDLAWLTAWVLGEAPVPDPGNAERPWPEAALGGPVLPVPAVDLELAIARLTVGERLTIINADVGFDLADDGGRIALRGSLSTGIVQSNINFTFQDGQFALDGDLFLTEIPLETLVWQGGQGPVATGIVRISADFQSLGRSMGGLVAGLSGTGAVEITEGAFNYFAADAFDRVVDLVDQDGALTGESLRDAFTAFLDAGTIDIGDHPIAFTIAGGVVAPEVIRVEGGGMRVAGEGTIDLNRLALVSSWQLTGAGEFDDGPPPQAQISFDGPIEAPLRQVNVAPLAAYLSLRQLRETDRLEAEVLERERFLRIIARMEADRAAEEAAAAAEAAPEPAVGPPPASPDGAGAGDAAAASPP